MRLFRKKQPPIRVNRDQALNCIPAVTPGVHWQEQTDGHVLIEYPISIKPLLQAVFKRFNGGKEESMTKKLQLDAYGTRVFRQIDGEKSVRSIIEEFAVETTVTRQEAELSVTTFLRELGRRGIIVLH